MSLSLTRCLAVGASFLALSLFSLPSHAEVNLNINIGPGAPGYYGVLPIQGVTPQLWNSNPVVAFGAAIAGAPIYLTVPAKHRRNWNRYCSYYGACGVPVYFVRRGWYNKHYGISPPPPPPPPPRAGHRRPPIGHFAPDHRPPPPPGAGGPPPRRPAGAHRPPPRGPEAFRGSQRHPPGAGGPPPRRPKAVHRPGPRGPEGRRGDRRPPPGRGGPGHPGGFR